MLKTKALSDAARLAFFSIALAAFPIAGGAQEQESEAKGEAKAAQALKADPLALEGEGAGGEAASSAEPRNDDETPLTRGRREPISASTPEGETRQPTEITASKETSFDEKARKVVFVGEVVVKDPEFNLSCERLTVFLKKGGEGTTTPAASEGNGGLERVIAEGKVLIIQEKPDEKGKITRYIGKAAKVEYNGVTGDVTLSGWPQIQQGINNQVATEEGTVMILNRNGRMKTVGASKTVIAESAEPTKREARGTGGNSPQR